MSNYSTKSKIQPTHTERTIYIYVRQSTVFQVHNNTASTARQYNLESYALDLGWDPEKIFVDDKDQGLSGTTTDNRSGFKEMLNRIDSGQVGAVLSLETSRVARHCTDWYNLLKLCAENNTLIIDADGIYDPKIRNDWLLLGIKGTLSADEIHTIMDRLHGGKLEKAKNGELRLSLPVGLVYDEIGRVVHDPDQEIQSAVRMIFDLFDHYRSGMAVFNHFKANSLLFPTLGRGKSNRGRPEWKDIDPGRVNWILHHPAYAGLYAYGRTKTVHKKHLGDSSTAKRHLIRLNREEWQFVRYDFFEGYISWEKYLENQEILKSNMPRSESKGAPRSGPALLQGIVLCGKCGYKLCVQYHRIATYYSCASHRKKYDKNKPCLRVSSKVVDNLVEGLFLQAVAPAQLEVSVNTVEKIEERTRSIEKQWELRLERARYETELAYRQYSSVEPENRLVARCLETKWNDALKSVENLEHEYMSAKNSSPRLLSDDERSSVMALTQDLKNVWHDATTNYVQRKQLLRCLIDNITLNRDEDIIYVTIRWLTGVYTDLETKLANQWEAFRTDPALIDLLRKLGPDHSDQDIAHKLNDAGWKTKRGLPFTKERVFALKRLNKIPSFRPKRRTVKVYNDGRYSTKEASQLLKIAPKTISKWCNSGYLDAVRVKPYNSWRIKLTSEQISGTEKRERWQTSRRPLLTSNILKNTPRGVTA